MLYGLPDTQLNKYQAAMNAGARLIFGARGREHISHLLKQFHWLRMRQRIQFKIACLTWRCLNGSGPDYLVADLQRTGTSIRRRGLRSESSHDLIPPRVHNKSHGERAWPSAAPSVWNSLTPASLKTESNYLTFRKGVKSCLWTQSYSG